MLRSSSRLRQSGLRLRVLASSERVSRRARRRDTGPADAVGLLGLRLGGLGLLSLLSLLLLLGLLFLLSTAPVGPQQVFERIFQLVESIGSYCGEWLAKATKRAERVSERVSWMVRLTDARHDGWMDVALLRIRG